MKRTITIIITAIMLSACNMNASLNNGTSEVWSRTENGMSIYTTDLYYTNILDDIQPASITIRISDDGTVSFTGIDKAYGKRGVIFTFNNVYMTVDGESYRATEYDYGYKLNAYGSEQVARKIKAKTLTVKIADYVTDEINENYRINRMSINLPRLKEE